MDMVWNETFCPFSWVIKTVLKISACSYFMHRFAYLSVLLKITLDLLCSWVNKLLYQAELFLSLN